MMSNRVPISGLNFTYTSNLEAVSEGYQQDIAGHRNDCEFENIKFLMTHSISACDNQLPCSLGQVLPGYKSWARFASPFFRTPERGSRALVCVGQRCGARARCCK